MSDDPAESPSPNKRTESTNLQRTSNALPFLHRYPIIAGAMAGVLLRLVFSGRGKSAWSAMVGGFIFFAPIVVGMLTVYLAERQRRRSWTYYFAAPMLATTLFVAGTLALLIEGWICAFVIVPMFAVISGLAGLAMGWLCRRTNWPQPPLYCAAALPFVLASLAPHIPTPPSIGVIERSVVVHAPAETVWRYVNSIENIQPEEMASAMALKIGVPAPVSAITKLTMNGRIRRSNWGKHVYFDEVIQDWQPERYVRWTYRFWPDSFPRAALDDHVVIGGYYFNVLDTSLLLEPEPGAATTRLTTRVRYRISTQFNFYANWVAQLLLGNLSSVGLNLYKSRSEREFVALSPREHQP
jgi:hypothetical protein